VGFKDDEYTAKVAQSEKEDCQLVEAGFEDVCDHDGNKIFKKRKQGAIHGVKLCQSILWKKLCGYAQKKRGWELNPHTMEIYLARLFENCEAIHCMFS
jgi:hypothetical protein